MGKIRAIIKRTDEQFGHMTNISTRLENLQKLVGGYIEVVTIKPGLVIICNEEGEILGLPKNMPFCGDYLVGDIVVIGTEGEEFTDIPIEFAEWMEIVKKYKEGKA